MGLPGYAYGLNLNNEVFGFYNGSPQYVVQREYYHPTYAGGIRWTSNIAKSSEFQQFTPDTVQHPANEYERSWPSQFQSHTMTA